MVKRKNLLLVRLVKKAQKDRLQEIVLPQLLTLLDYNLHLFWIADKLPWLRDILYELQKTDGAGGLGVCIGSTVELLI